MTECGVCCGVVKKCGSCVYCGFTTCRPCVQRYLLELPVSAKCMSCSKVWNRETIEKVASASFSNGAYKTHKENLLFEQQKALMPSLQNKVANLNKIDKIGRLIRDMEFYHKNLPRKDPEKAVIMTNILQLQQLSNNPMSKPPEDETTDVVRKCPCDNCKGFLNRKWKCKLCDTTICAKCNEPKKSDHKCDPDMVETIKLIKKDTKGCPKCGTMISKISGCSQMWCPDCHTTFDWNTGHIDTGIQHNPHYFEYMRKNGGLARQPGDGGCNHDNGLPPWRDLMTMYAQHHLDKVTNIYRGVIHLMEVELNKYRSPFNWRQTSETLLINYMRNRLSEDAFKDKLQREDKFREKIQEFRHVCEMFRDVCGDNMRQLILDNDYETFFVKTESIKIYTEECLNKVGNIYKCVVPKINLS